MIPFLLALLLDVDALRPIPTSKTLKIVQEIEASLRPTDKASATLESHIDALKQFARPLAFMQHAFDLDPDEPVYQYEDVYAFLKEQIHLLMPMIRTAQANPLSEPIWLEACRRELVQMHQKVEAHHWELAQVSFTRLHDLWQLSYDRYISGKGRLDITQQIVSQLDPPDNLEQVRAARYAYLGGFEVALGPIGYSFLHLKHTTDTLKFMVYQMGQLETLIEKAQADPYWVDELWLFGFQQQANEVTKFLQGGQWSLAQDTFEPLYAMWQFAYQRLME